MKTKEIDFYNKECSFFIVVPLSFEEIAKRELLIKWPTLEQILKEFFNSNESYNLKINVIEGGIELETHFLAGVLLNLLLKVPSRILLRIETFKCRDFPSLYKKIGKIEWRYFINDKTPEFQISTKRSRLMHSGRIEKTLKDAFKRYFQMNPPKADHANHIFKVFIRVVDDSWTISLDTSGELLYKRGLNKKTHQAPIRDNLAAGLLIKLITALGNSNLLSTEHLIDPMMGSGTFLLEGLQFFELSKMRTYSFENIGYFKKLFASDFNKFKSEFTNKERKLFKNFHGSDIQKSALEIVKHNVHNLLKDSKININLKEEDLFSDESTNINNHQNLVIVNPPYGKRIKFNHKMKKYYINLMNKIIEKFSPTGFGILIPYDYNMYLDIEKNFIKYQLIENFTFKNGNIRINFLILKLKYIIKKD